ncbi:response regulator transcription factor [Aquibacillus sp. 3ASR75-11]|uniref:Response regulator transcription factor n=1 Tax=Terrihalobacillus insolitus TaxID=2950438 RepID=A0A9X4APK5_9BACI|nr:response regulator transcription factor [Terrihalobacillus insolitus]MDC3414800.1 response regulator transcription factor [Terrihalobacillus insolitus]MDC3425635.1 response regulator transcription factor [Terrihalobacillus insolitus]
MEKRILVVDDEWNMRNLVRIYLTKEGNILIDEAVNGKEALQKALVRQYDVIMLDIMLPDIDGWEVCSTLRKKIRTPILMLTARNDIKDRVHGLNLGADDYLVKPFAPEELVARVNALLRRYDYNQEDASDATLSVMDLSIYRDSREVTVNKTPIELTPKEFDILYTVASQPKRVFTRDILLDSIWLSTEFRDVRAVDTHVKNIREKLRNAGLSFNPIKTVWGVGYKFYLPEDQTEHE